MNIVILLGPPGSGKGTVSEHLCRKQHGYVHWATGDMLRREVARGSAVGEEAKGYMKAGELVPDGTIIRIVEARMETMDCDRPILFDGFPRTLRQAELLEDSLARHGAGIAAVLLLEVQPAVLIQRLGGRWVCQDCGAVFHVTNIPPKVEGMCDHCGGKLQQRKDDKPTTINNRLEVYTQKTEALIARYEARGLLKRLRGDQGLEKLAEKINILLA